MSKQYIYKHLISSLNWYTYMPQQTYNSFDAAVINLLEIKCVHKTVSSATSLSQLVAFFTKADIMNYMKIQSYQGNGLGLLYYLFLQQMNFI